jgi:cytochrome c oxidase assembly factor CtaG
MTSAAGASVKGRLLICLASGCAVTATALSVPPLRSVIEQSMAWHMVFQMPLLVLAGALAHAAWPPRFGARTLARLSAFNQYGLTGFMAAQVIIAYWMLPMALDRAVVQPPFDALKLLTLFISGLLLADAFKRAPNVLQLFFMGYWVPMMCWLGIYFATTELRLCNAYSLQSQVATGWGLLVLGLVLGMVWGAKAWRLGR